MSLPETLLQGNEAIAMAAHRAGCSFFAGYPITPSSEVMGTMSRLLGAGDGTFIQMEDEIASIGAAIGASWSGAKAMTATSGPGLSLMQEAIGYAYFTETPLVIVDVQRAGPATGQATHVSQGDVMQYKYGSHGDIFPIVLCPWSVQECYGFTILAFNLAETYRLPVFVAADEAVGHLRENVQLPLRITLRERDRFGAGDPFGSDRPDGVPPMPAFGDGRALMVTGSTHDGTGFRRVDAPEVHDALVTRLMNKTMMNQEEIVQTQSYLLDDATHVFVACGICARGAREAVDALRAGGCRAGLLRMKTLWPFPEKAIRDLGAGVRHIIVPELNKGMLVSKVAEWARCSVHPLNQTDGRTMSPDTMVAFAQGLQ